MVVIIRRSESAGSVSCTPSAPPLVLVILFLPVLEPSGYPGDRDLLSVR